MTLLEGDALRDEQKAHLDECRKQSGAIESALDDCRMRLKVICDYLDGGFPVIEYTMINVTNRSRS